MSPESQERDPALPLTDHLEELRSRLIWCFASVVLFSIAGWYGVQPTIQFLARPVGSFVFLGPTDALFFKIKIAMFLGLFLSAPLIFYHGWRFVERALLGRERSLISLLVPASLLLFIGGAALAIFGVSPIAVQFLLSFQGETLRPFITLNAHLSFLFWMVLGFGLLFQLPLAVFFVCQTGLISPKKLGEFRKHVVVGLLIAAAVLTPGPDVVSQLILTIPTYALFEISLLIARLTSKK